MTTTMIHRAMLNVMTDLSPIGKDKQNQHFKYNFRGIDAVYREIHPLLKKHGIYQTSKVLYLETKFEGKTCTAIIKITYVFTAEDGSSVSTEVVGMGADTGDKATNKALSGAHKYALLQAFVIPCDGIDEQDASDFQYSKAQAKHQPNDDIYMDTPEYKSWLWTEGKSLGMSPEAVGKVHAHAAKHALSTANTLEVLRGESSVARQLADMQKQGVTS